FSSSSRVVRVLTARYILKSAVLSGRREQAVTAAAAVFGPNSVDALAPAQPQPAHATSAVTPSAPSAVRQPHAAGASARHSSRRMTGYASLSTRSGRCTGSDPPAP